MKINLTGTKNIKVFGLIGLIILVLLVMVVGIIKSYISSPSIGTVTASKSSVTTANQPTMLIVEGKTFSFSYPNVFSPTTADSLSSTDVEKFAFVNAQSNLWNLYVMIRKLPSGQLSGDGSYNLRIINPQQYTEQQQTINGNVVYIMSDTSGGYNKTAFIVHGTIDANITLTSNSTIDSVKIDQALNQILSTWKWL